MTAMERALLLAASGCWACARSSPPPMPSKDAASWSAVERAWALERAAPRSRPWAASLAMTMREPRAGRTLDGRGALAVAPGRALRMVLVGPAGTTTLDAWVTPDAFRIAVPPADVLRRGGRGDPPDLPVGFLRWLFFRPLEGTLFSGSLEGGQSLFLLRDQGAVLDVRVAGCDRGERFTITRRAAGHAERLDECRAAGASGPATAGDRVSYEDETSGLRIELRIEAVTDGAPAEAAFTDPDAGPKGAVESDAP